MSEVNNPNPVSEPQVTSKENFAPSGNGNKSKRKRTNGVLIGVIVVLVGVVGIMAYALLRPKPQNEDVTDGRATWITPENAEEVREQLSQPVSDAYYTTSMTVDWYFDNGQAVSTTAIVKNSTRNTRTVYFDVTLQDSGELVYSSPYLPVGETIDQITLDKDLDAGDYPAVCTYYLVDDDHKVITHVSVAVNIHILN